MIDTTLVFNGTPLYFKQQLEAYAQLMVMNTFLKSNSNECNYSQLMLYVTASSGMREKRGVRRSLQNGPINFNVLN